MISCKGIICSEWSLHRTSATTTELIACNQLYHCLTSYYDRLTHVYIAMIFLRQAAADLNFCLISITAPCQSCPACALKALPLSPFISLF